MAKYIVELDKDYQKINKKKITIRIAEFQNQLKTSMQFWPRGTLEKIKKREESNLTPSVEKESIKEDIHFLEKMMNDREASYSSRDVKHAESETSKIRKTEQKMKRQLDNNSKLKMPSTPSIIEDSDEEEEDDKDNKN